jgi:hypothetical protein
MTKILIMKAAKHLNFFPAKQGISQHYSIVQEWFFIRNILTIQKIASIPLEPMFKLTMSQTQRIISLLERLIASIYIIETCIKEDTSYFTYQLTRSLQEETSPHFQSPSQSHHCHQQGHVYWSQDPKQVQFFTLQLSINCMNRLPSRSRQQKQIQKQIQSWQQKLQRWSRWNASKQDCWTGTKLLTRSKSRSQPPRLRSWQPGSRSRRWWVWIEIEINFETNNNIKTEEESEPENPLFDCLISTRSGRVSRPVHKYVTTHQGHLQTQAIKSDKYLIETGKVITWIILTMNYQFAQTYSLIKGIKDFGNKGHQAAHKEMKQLHNCIVFKPILVEVLTAVEWKHAMESLIVLNKKKDGRIKARTCANRNTQHEYTKRNKAASFTAITESHFITAVINAKQGWDIMTTNIPIAFVQTDIEKKSNGEKIIMKIRGQLVDMLVDISPWDYQDFVHMEGN